MGSCGGDPHARPRRPRARRGRRAGRLRDRTRALGDRRPAAESRRLDRHDGTQPRDRPDPAREGVPAQGRAPRASAGASRRGGRRERDPRRAPRPRLHLLSPRALRREPRRADPARGRGAHDGRDRACLPRRRAGNGPAARAGEAQDPGGGHPVPRPAGSPPARAPALGARSALPRVQRGLRGDRGIRPRPGRPVRRGDPPREAPRRADAGRG